MRRNRKAAKLLRAAGRVDFATERHYNISFEPGGSGRSSAMADDGQRHSLYAYQTELNRIRIELFRLQRNVKNLQLPALEVVGLSRLGEDIGGLKGELKGLLGKVADVANLDPLKSALGGFLEVADSCERVLAIARTTEGIPESVLTGVESIHRLLLSKLKRLGVEVMRDVTVFDPNHHMAIATVKDPAKPNGTIAEVHLSGYLLGEQILRTAQVVVVRNSRDEKTH